MTGNSGEVMYTINNNEHRGKEGRERTVPATHYTAEGRKKRRKGKGRRKKERERERIGM